MNITATNATGPVLGRFRPKEIFNWIKYDEDGIPTVMGRYLPKFEYVARTDELLDQARQWVTEGKVSLREG